MAKRRVHRADLSNNADGIFFTEGSTGSVERSLEDNLNDLLSVKNFDAKGDGTTDDKAAIANCDAVGDFYFPSGSYKVSSDITIANDVWFAPGASLSIDSGKTVTFTKRPYAGKQQIFTGLGTPTGFVDPEFAWFGAIGDGTTDNTTAFNNVIVSANTGDTIRFPAPDTEDSFFLCTGQIDVGKRLKLVGGMTKIKGTGAKLFNITEPQTIIQDFNLLGDLGAGNVAITLNQNYQKILHCQIEEFEQAIDVAGGVWHHLSGIRMRNIKTTVMTVGNVIGTVVQDVRYDTDTGSFTEPTTGILLNGEGCDFSGLDFIHAGNAIHIKDTSARDVNWCFFNSCSFDTSTRAVLVENLNSGHVVKGLMFDHCWFSSHSEEGVKLTGQSGDALDGVTFHNCYFLNNTKNGITVDADAQNIDINGSTFSGNSAGSATYDHIEHNSGGRLIVSNCFFGNWGNQITSVAFKIQRNSGAGEIVIDGCTALGDGGSGDFDDNSVNTAHIGQNFGDLPSTAGTDIPNSTTKSSANINITSSSGTFNTVELESTGLSALQATTTSAANFGIVAKNSGGGAGLRVAQGTAEFVGGATFDATLGVTGTATHSGASVLTGAVSGAGFVTAADARVTYEVLNAKSDVGTGATQVSRGNHGHVQTDITDQPKFNVGGEANTTNGSGVGTITHGLGLTPGTIIAQTLGDASVVVTPTATGATTFTYTARDLATHGLKTSAALFILWFVAE